jgi:hypothetical protein
MKFVGDRCARMLELREHADGAAGLDHASEFGNTGPQAEGAPRRSEENEQQRKDSAGEQPAKQILARRG